MAHLRIRRLGATAVVVFGCCVATAVQAGDLESPDAVRRAVLRQRQLVSGRFEYWVTHSYHGTGSRDESRAIFSFAGPSWIIRCPPPHGTGTVLSHDDKHILYTEVNQQNGSLRRSATIGKPNVLDHNPPPPLFAGGVWDECTIQFIGAKRGQAKGERTIDGVRCELYEWPVSEADLPAAFRAWTDIARGGGTLRLYIARELGFAAPLIEHVGLDGAIAASFESKEFREVVPGLFFPKTCRRVARKRAGPLYTIEYRLERIEKVNEPLDNQEFAIQLPIGTEVLDTRSGRAISYTIREDLPASVMGLQHVDVVEPPSFFQRNRGWAIAAGSLLGVLVLAGIWLYRRRGQGA
jgi:hypothetical protein